VWVVWVDAWGVWVRCVVRCVCSVGVSGGCMGWVCVGWVCGLVCGKCDGRV
jgi:hypothetical protein